MPASISKQVVSFYRRLFDRLFTERFAPDLEDDPLRQGRVERQVQEAADAASGSLIRFFTNQQAPAEMVETMLVALDTVCQNLLLERVSASDVPPDAVAEELLRDAPCPLTVEKSGLGTTYRVALHAITQVLLLIGPVMSEWQSLNFAATFELPQRVVNRLNEIGQSLALLGESGSDDADERYELLHRDYLSQRFYQIEVGTVRMTTNRNVDVRELFVMPRLRPRPKKALDGGDAAGLASVADLMTLDAARKLLSQSTRSSRPSPAQLAALVTPETSEKPAPSKSVLSFVRRRKRTVLVGAPGSGKSTFLEWLQLQVASGDEEFPLNGAQAIPLLLRVRQLDLENLPRGAALIGAATQSQDRAALMPEGWMERQMSAGRILFLLDGIDETEPELRDEYMIPWLREMCRKYRKCQFVVSSRPVGYPPGALRPLDFHECDLLDFDDEQIAEYARHWCVAVRLAQNEAKAEARREGEREGAKIVDGFQSHPYIRDLARNPLMLSAICLVNYFEGGELPRDRAMLYRLCVEGLLHHWDQRRGIHSEFGLDEKLRVCREIAIAMQADDRAEYTAAAVIENVTATLSNVERAERLVEHIRRRTGLLIERRPNVFAFAHLTFQEYLTARAIIDGNRTNITINKITDEHSDSRWREVIPLYCGLTSTNSANALIRDLLTRDSSHELATILADAYTSGGPKFDDEPLLEVKVIDKIAGCPFGNGVVLDRFRPDTVAPVANKHIEEHPGIGTTQAHSWLVQNKTFIDLSIMKKITIKSLTTPPFQVSQALDLYILAESLDGIHDLLEQNFLMKIKRAESTTSMYLFMLTMSLFTRVNLDESTTRHIPQTNLPYHKYNAIFYNLCSQIVRYLPANNAASSATLIFLSAGLITITQRDAGMFTRPPFSHVINDLLAWSSQVKLSGENPEHADLHALQEVKDNCIKFLKSIVNLAKQ